ncbi:MAG: 23S rRNA (uracil(1939)-C(5))-methyltransferase RlmD [Lachnospiraceae bacterium]|nr:23S rRNA (uracil(1939)-C(5))-methyltransferase RlmD [Lachnospiraceae bacterium]
MKRGELLEGVVERVEFPNKGLVRIDDNNTLWVKNVIPGQHVSVRVKKVRNGAGEGMLKEVIKKADNEIDPPCSYFNICGGCTYTNLSYEDQLRLKEDQVHRLLDKVLKDQEAPYEWCGIKGSPKENEYRNKMEFTFGDEYKDGPLSLGMHKRGGFFDVVCIDDCKICDEDYRRILVSTRDFFRKSGLKFYHRMNHQGYLRHLLVRKASHTGEILVAIVTTTQEEYDMSGYVGMLRDLKLDGEIVGILHTFNDSLSDVVQNDRTEVLFGRDHICEELLGLKFNISEFSFFQTNSYSAEVLYETVRDLIGDLGKKDKTVYDLYSGTGTIAQLMAPVSRKVIGVEIVEEAVLAARQNAVINGLDNCEFIAGDVLAVLDDITEKPVFIILDPPREGIHPKALPKITGYGIDRLIYVSCNPVSLARDLKDFILAGYRVEKSVCVDQFPGTCHVESVCLMSKV